MATMDLLERAQRCHDYIKALEEERKKIEVFQRELPLCLQLVTQAIESMRQQMGGGHDQWVSSGLVLEEFIPLRPTPASPIMTKLDEEEEGRSDASKRAAPAPMTAIGVDTKPDWLRSVQLWNQEPDTVLKVEPPKKPIVLSLKKTGGAFQPFEREKYVAAPPSAAAAVSSTVTSGGSTGRGGSEGEKEKEGQSQSPHRKARRSWSPELHRRFLHVLQQLGGSHVATPKQIRELMKIDGLTNDEIKSHLQKHRLYYNRRPSSAAQSSSISSPPTPQFVLVGGIIVPPPDYTAQPGNGACAPPLNEIYASVLPSLPSDLRPQQQQQQTKTKKQSQGSTTRLISHSEGRCSGKEDGIRSDYEDNDDTINSDSPSATSASSQTTTVSPPF